MGYEIVKATIHLIRQDIEGTDADGHIWLTLEPDLDMVIPFKLGPDRKDRNGRNLWGWNGNLDAPTLTPSYLCRANMNGQEARLHCLIRNGVIELCPDSNITTKPGLRINRGKAA